MTSETTLDTSMLLCPGGYMEIDIPGGRAYVRQDVTAKQLHILLTHKADILKESSKSQVKRIGHWVIKETRHSPAAGMLGRAARRPRSAWMAAHRLRQHHVHVPEPLAYVEYMRLGVCTRTVHVFQYLSHCPDIEFYLSERIHAGAEGEELAAFLSHLAAAVNGLVASGAYHGDLSGKNIMTRDGHRFYFVDLDAVELGRTYDEDKRLKNHVQLYDSFCDALSDALLVPFIQAMLPETVNLRVWMPRVREEQARRRAKIEKRWEEHGPPERMNPLRAFRDHALEASNFAEAQQ